MKYTKETWKNGLTALYVPMKSTGAVTVLVAVGVGSRHETKRTNGLSHFLEHMMFKGTEKRPDKTQVAQELDAVGAEYNAGTSKEMTMYYVKADMRHTELAVDVVSDIFLNSTIPAEEIEKERGVILGEIDMYEDLPMSKIGWIFEELLYPDQPFGRDILGPKENIRNLTRKDFLSFRKKHYTAANTTVVVAGNITTPKARALLKKYFAGMPSGKSARPVRAKHGTKGPHVRVEKKKTDQTHLVIGIPAYTLSDERRWAARVLSVILGGNMSSRLFIKLRDELGMGYYVRADSTTGPDYGYIDVSTGVDRRRVGEAVRAICDEFVAVREQGVSASELTKAKEYLKGRALLSLESSSSVAAFFGRQQMLEGEILTPKQKFSMIDAVQEDDVHRVAQDLFITKKLHLALIGPHSGTTSFTKALKV